ncbi:MBL fold metallo-hydrolase [Pseudomonas entomophila]|uniref:MBL fold metallo-hydrolase n=1 Tax=Pseudomonas entomophila TaxID=312306 RepID=UPI00200F4974|nr:MBL fold metallo-hydrolase [Pseudomonas entomophila]
MRTTVWLVLWLVFSTCAQGAEDDYPKYWNARGLPEPKIQFLGVGGWLIRWRGEGVMLAPSFSNPSGLSKGLPPLRVEADKARIDQYMQRLKAQDVTLLLVGHGHYDHLLDVPWIMRRYTPKAIVYGSDTVVHMLRAMKDPTRQEDAHWTWVDPERVKSARGYMATVPGCDGQRGPARPGYWITSRGGHIRAMPIQSMHAPHVLGYTVGHGNYTQDLSEVPTTVSGWKQGQSMAWLIDLLDETGKLKHRIHFQDSAASAPCGILPVRPDGEAVDVELLSVGSWRKAAGYPDRLLKAYTPRVVVLGHWENFFGYEPDHPRPLSTKAVEQMQRHVQQLAAKQVPAAQVYLPKPFAEIPLPPAQDHERSAR